MDNFVEKTKKQSLANKWKYININNNGGSFH